MGRMTREEATAKLKQYLDSNLIEDISGYEGIEEAISIAIEALEAQEWIPCDKGKPDPYRRVLMTERRPDWNGKEYYIVTLDSFCNHRGDVVAWMLLPDPFKEDDE